MYSKLDPLQTYEVRLETFKKIFDEFIRKDVMRTCEMIIEALRTKTSRYRFSDYFKSEDKGENRVIKGKIEIGDFADGLSDMGVKSVSVRDIYFLINFLVC